MRFVWAVTAFVVAAVLIGAGIAQRTIFQGPTTTSAELSVSEETPFVLIDGAVLNSEPGTQTLRAYGEGEVFASYGRTADMRAWLSDATFTSITLNDDGEVRTTVITPSETAAGEATGTSPQSQDPEASPTASPDAEAEAPVEGRNPAGSDLWLDEYQQTDVLIAALELPSEMSVLIAADGTVPAPSDITITWPISNSTPWAGPLIVAGGVFLALGVFLYILGIRHARRSRGPRRKGLPLPMTEPIDLSVEEADKGVISSGGAPTSRRLERGKRAFIAVPAVAVSAALFAGCSAEVWPDLAPSASPSPSQTVIVPEGQQAPAVTEVQAARILSKIGETVSAADEANDEVLAATRLEGAALAARKTNYTLRKAIEFDALAPILTHPLEITLPQAYDEWPRSVLMVVDDSESKTSSIMIMTQADPWSQYKVGYVASLEASTEMPDLAPAYIGAPQIQPDSPFLVMPPEEVAAAYADILDLKEESPYYDMFEADGDQFRVSVEADRQKRLAEFNQTGSQTGTMTFDAQAGRFDPFALATLESGAIVAVSVSEVDTTRPTDTAAQIRLPNAPTVQVLAGTTQSSTGFTTTYGDQLFFYVPAQGSNEKIRILGYGSSILESQVNP